MNLYHIKLTDNQKDALERLFNMGIVWNKTELSEAWEQLREQLREASCTVAIINAIQNSECNCKKPTAPKYDPRRKFKKDDIVRVVERHGRYQPNIPVDEFWKGLCTVAEDEDFCNNLVKVRSEDGREKLSHWWYLELITPVEEQEPYVVRLAKPDGVEEWHVEPRNNTLALVAVFGHRHPHAKAAAEAECARLNSEYRKEQE